MMNVEKWTRWYWSDVFFVAAEEQFIFTEKFFSIFTKIGITFSYRTSITKFLAHWKDCYEGYVMTRYRVSFGLYSISSSCDRQKVWFIFLGFSCDDICLSWIEFIFDIIIWSSILVYIFEVIMKDMMMMLCTFMVWYDTLYDDNACDNDVHSMMLMHFYTIWCTCIP